MSVVDGGGASWELQTCALVTIIVKIRKTAMTNANTLARRILLKACRERSNLRSGALNLRGCDPDTPDIFRYAFLNELGAALRSLS